MATPKDPYNVLGVDRNASKDDIRRAYRTLARKYHPDVNKAPDAAERFAEIQEAYALLSDDEKRRQYDRFGHAGIGAGAAGGAGAAAAGGAGPRVRWTTAGGSHVNVDDLGSIFEEVFGGGGAGVGAGSFSGFGRGGQAQAGPRPHRGRDVDHEITVTFMTAARGGTEHLRTAGGETLDVRIPAGIEDGGKLRVRGKGQPGRHGGPAGDLILTVRVGAHPWFRRDGLDILLDVPVTVAEAALGASVDVPMLSGSVQIKIPSGASSGQKLRVPGRGITDSKGRSGDFYAVVQIVAPRDLSPEDRRALENLAPRLHNPRDDTPWAAALRSGST